MSLALLLALVGATTSSVAEPANVYALIVGYNASTDGSRPQLRFADDDAARFYELLAPISTRAILLTSFDDDSQQLFPGLVSKSRPPTLENLERAARMLSRAIAKDRKQEIRSELYFFYAGHGEVIDGVGSVSLVDQPLSRPRFKALMKQLSADALHIIVDACKSYYLVAGRGPGGRRVHHETPFSGPDRAPGVGYILSTSSEADTHEWAALSSGIFSHEVRSGLLGAGDANNDGAVSYEELAAFVAVANESIPTPSFRPKVFIRPPIDDRQRQILKLNRIRRASILEVGPTQAGRISIMDQRGLRYADTHKRAGDTLRIALLQPRRYEVMWQGRSWPIETLEPKIMLGARPRLADAGGRAKRPAPRL